MMWRQYAGRALTQVQPRRFAARVLQSNALGALSPGAPRLSPVAPEPHSPTAFAERLRPYRRDLWLRRAVLVLVRAARLTLIWLLLVTIVRRLWFANLPLLPAVVLAVLLIGAAIWLAYAQRPTLAETARLLDQRFALYDQLGTAVEDSAESAPTALTALQRARAAALLDRLPPHPWEVSLLPGRDRTLLLALAAGMTGMVLTTPGSLHSAVNNATAAAYHNTNHQTQVPSLKLRRQLLAQRAETMHAISLARHGAIAGSRTAQPLSFAASLQVRPDAQTASSTVSANSSVPDTLQTSLTGSAAATRASTARTTDAGNPGAPAKSTAAPGKASSGKGSGAPAGSNGKAQQGQGGSGGASQGARQPSDPQQPANPQGDPQGNALGDPAQVQSSALPQGKQPKHAAAQSNGAAGTATNSANPFGTDPAAANANPSASRLKGGRTAKTSDAGTQSASPRTGTGKGVNSRANAGHSPSGAGPQDGALRPGGGGRGSNIDHTAEQKSAPVKQAGAATGPQLTLGGHSTVSSGNPGPLLVRVAPLSAPPSAAQAGSAAIGPSLVQGYVPEDATQLSSEDQALLRAYFAQGSQ